MSSKSIPLGDAASLRRLTTRTQLIRLGLAAAIVLLALLAVLSARTSTNRNGPILPAGSDGIVVLDLSASASANEYVLIHRYLNELVKSNGRFGLVLFSDRAYEALPPNAPAATFESFARYFAPPYPTNPWAAGFSLGTSISQGLDLAHNVLDADGVQRRNVWLISDLSDSHSDRPLLSRSLQSYVSSGIELHVLPIQPNPRDLVPYRRLFGTQSPTIRVKPLPTAPPPSKSYAFPIALAVLALLVALALTANELVSAPLRWGRRPSEARA